MLPGINQHVNVLIAFNRSACYAWGCRPRYYLHKAYAIQRTDILAVFQHLLECLLAVDRAKKSLELQDENTNSRKENRLQVLHFML